MANFRPFCILLVSKTVHDVVNTDNYHVVILTERADSVPFTHGFKTQWQLEDHFYDHCGDFSVCGDNTSEDMEKYEALADTFLGGPRGPTTRECIRRRDHARARYNLATEEWGCFLRTDTS
jgi:hypothetical protein